MSENSVLVNNSSMFFVLDTHIELIQSETAYGLQTVAIVWNGFKPDVNVYLDGEHPVSIETAINVYQEMVGALLSQEQFDLVIKENSSITPVV